MGWWFYTRLNDVIAPHVYQLHSIKLVSSTFCGLPAVLQQYTFVYKSSLYISRL